MGLEGRRSPSIGLLRTIPSRNNSSKAAERNHENATYIFLIPKLKLGPSYKVIQWSDSCLVTCETQTSSYTRCCKGIICFCFYITSSLMALTAFSRSCTVSLLNISPSLSRCFSKEKKGGKKKEVSITLPSFQTLEHKTLPWNLAMTFSKGAL